MKAASVSRSATPRKAASSPMGSSSGAMPAPKVARSWSSVRSKSARSRSSLLTKTMRGRSERGAAAPHDLGLHLDALDRAHHEHGQVGDPQGGLDVADEVGVAGRVDQVDLVARPLERGHGQRDRDAALLLLGLGVGGRRAVLDPPDPVDGAGSGQQRLGQGGLPAAAVAHEGHVADLVGRVALHPNVDPPRSPSPDVSGRMLPTPSDRETHGGARSAQVT